MKRTTLLPARLLTRHACLPAALWFLVALAFGPPPAHAAVTEAWVHRYNGPANNSDVARAVAVDGSGAVVVTGCSASRYDYGESPPYRYPVCDYYTAKYAAVDGALLWEQRYNGPTDSDDQAQAVAVDGNDNVVVTGYSHNGTNYDYYTAKYATADGALLWEKRYNGPANSDDLARALAVDSNGNVVVTGSSSSSASNHTHSDYYTAKYAAADGALLWEKRYNGPADKQDDARAVAVDGSGNVVVTGYSDGGYTAKYSAGSGALLWEKRCISYARALAVDSSGNVLMTGESHNGTNTDYYTAKYAAADGALLWEKRYNGPANNDDIANAVTVDASGDVVVTGSSRNGAPSYDYDYYAAKYAAADGALLWEQRYNDPANFNNSAQVVVDGSDNVVVAGSSYNGTNSDYYAAKYASKDGALLWEKRYNGPANGDDTVGQSAYFGGASPCLALGPNGMVVLTGSSIGDGGTFDYATVVYRETLPPVVIALVPTGIHLRFTGVPGRSYTVERAPTVTGPWSTIYTQTVPTSGLLEYLDAAPFARSAFYRTVQP